MEYVPADEMIGQTRRTSVAASTVSVPTPSRDLSFRQGAYTGNILRLEQSAEEMSAGGSDIGEEIRRMNEAERLSRRSSVQSSRAGSTTTAPLDILTKSRQNSYANSIVDVNNNARAGGFSPGAFVTSPVGSVHSASWSRAPIHRESSTASRPLGLAGMIEMSFEDEPESLDTHDFAMPSRQLSQSSYAAGDDGATTQRNSNQPTVHEPSASGSAILVSYEEAAAAAGEEQEGVGTVTPPMRPSSTDTFQQAQTAFHDFDGVHCSTELEEYIQLDQDGNEIRRISGRSSSGTATAPRQSMLFTPTAEVPLGAPPPEEGMVFYPAPVPRMLNLPKRLSQLPAASVQAKRRTQAMSQMYAPTRNSAAWLSQGLDNTRAPVNERMSVANFSNVPPQLRASVFFEHQTVVQDVDVKSESAVATLDSILAASATAPVSAFTDHPYAGDISKTVYAPEKLNRRSTANDLRSSTIAPLTNRKSNLSALLKRASSANALDGTVRGSTYTLLDPQIDGRKGQMSTGVDQAASRPMAGTIAEEDEDDAQHSVDLEPHETGLNDDQTEYDDEFEDDEDVEPDFAQPTTLLAELQSRKAQLKSRNRTAVTAFPNGMHSTLLELDAVATIEKKKRSNQRVALAWEDPNLKQETTTHDAEDDDLPLGMLFPSKNGLLHRKMGDTNDWDRPLGLMEKREMEDNEPLSSRRSRLRGEPIRPRPVQRVMSEQSVVGGQEGEVLDDETLNQRLKRMSTKDALDGALVDIVAKDGSRPLSTFTDDMLSHLNISDSKKEEPVDIENETLGQRRARLQREKEAAGSARPALQNRNSMSNLLEANPIGERKPSKEHTSTRGTLLFASQQAQAEHKRNMLASNSRITSGAQQRLAHSQSTADLAQPIYNGFGMQQSVSTPMFGMQNGGYFAQQPMVMPGYGVQPSAMMNPYAYGMLTGQPQMYPYAGLQQGMAYGYGAMQQPTVQQRSAIDQWRSNIA